MKPIRRLEGPPTGLADYLAVERDHPSWEGFRSHCSGAAYRELRSVLVENQRGLCGYCETALVPGLTQIEHVVPRSAPGAGPAKELDAGNLITSCDGGSKRPSDPEETTPPEKAGRSCGPAKGGDADPAFLDPRDLPSARPVFLVNAEGRIMPNEEACRAAGIPVSRVEATIRILGLDVERLRLDRAERWADLLEFSGEFEDDPVSLRIAAREALVPDDDGRLEEFFTTARAYFSDAAETVLAEAPEEWV